MILDEDPTFEVQPRYEGLFVAMSVTRCYEAGRGSSLSAGGEAHINFEGIRDPLQGARSRVGRTPLDPADVGLAHPATFCQLRLGQPERVAQIHDLHCNLVRPREDFSRRCERSVVVAPDATRPLRRMRVTPEINRPAVSWAIHHRPSTAMSACPTISQQLRAVMGVTATPSGRS